MTDKPSAMERAAEALNAAVQESGRTDFGGPIPVPNYRKAARAAILAYLSAIAEDEASVEAGARAMLADDTPKPSFDAAWENEKDIWMQNARSFLRTLLSRAKEQKP